MIVVEPPPQAIQKQLIGFSAEGLFALHSDTWIQQQLLALVGQLMPCLAHDIIQPLSAICNFTGGLQNKVANTPLSTEELSTTLDKIHNEAFRASDLVKRLRSFAKPFSSEPSSIAVNNAIRQSLELASGFFHSEQVVVRAALIDGLPCVHANSMRLQQVILNLLTNAVDAMSPLPSKARCVEITTGLCGEFVEISIKDFGPRISEDVYANLARPFFSTKRSALGLGLWACKTIVEGHRGELVLRQSSQQGLEAVVRLPTS